MRNKCYQYKKTNGAMVTLVGDAIVRNVFGIRKVFGVHTTMNVCYYKHEKWWLIDVENGEVIYKAPTKKILLENATDVIESLYEYKNGSLYFKRITIDEKNFLRDRLFSINKEVLQSKRFNEDRLPGTTTETIKLLTKMFEISKKSNPTEHEIREVKEYCMRCSQTEARLESSNL